MNSNHQITTSYANTLLVHYGLDLNGISAQAWIDRWAEDHTTRWIALAIIEALYLGRYKAVSVETILQTWQRRGKPICHFTHEFERVISRRFPKNLRNYKHSTIRDREKINPSSSSSSSAWIVSSPLPPKLKASTEEVFPPTAHPSSSEPVSEVQSLPQPQDAANPSPSDIDERKNRDSQESSRREDAPPQDWAGFQDDPASPTTPLQHRSVPPGTEGVPSSGVDRKPVSSMVTTKSATDLDVSPSGCQAADIQEHWSAATASGYPRVADNHMPKREPLTPRSLSFLDNDLISQFIPEMQPTSQYEKLRAISHLSLHDEDGSYDENLALNPQSPAHESKPLQSIHSTWEWEKGPWS